MLVVVGLHFEFKYKSIIMIVNDMSQTLTIVNSLPQIIVKGHYKWSTNSVASTVYPERNPIYRLNLHPMSPIFATI